MSCRMQHLRRALALARGYLESALTFIHPFLFISFLHPNPPTISPTNTARIDPKLPLSRFAHFLCPYDRIDSDLQSSIYQRCWEPSRHRNEGTGTAS